MSEVYIHKRPARPKPSKRERMLREIAKTIRAQMEHDIARGTLESEQFYRVYYGKQLAFIRGEIYDERVVYNHRLKMKAIRV